MTDKAALQQVFRRSPDIVARQIAGEMILVPIRHNIGDLDSIFTLNETAARVWALINEQKTLAEIHQQVLKEYDVPEQQLEQDILELVAALEKLNILEEVE